MKTARIAWLFLLLLLPPLIPLALLADDLTTIDGKVYHDVHIAPNRSDMHSVAFNHRSGFVKIEYDNMVDADKLKYGYDPDKVKADKEAQRIAKNKDDKVKIALAEDKRTDAERTGSYRQTTSRITGQTSGRKTGGRCQSRSG